MPKEREIRAVYDPTSIVIYGAYSPAIAVPALKAGRFVPPFSLHRMTWIKPSFLWLMERSNWGRKSGQERILAIRISRSGWEDALSMGVLTHPEPGLYRNAEDWKMQFDRAQVHIQWDPERNLRGASLDYGSIQVGISRHLIGRYVEEWILGIEEVTPLAHKIAAMIRSGNGSKAAPLLPKERVYPLSHDIARRIGLTR